MRLLGRKEKLYLSDKPPLTPIALVGLIFTYIILFSWVVVIIWPLVQMVITSFNGKQEQYLIVNSIFEFSVEHFEYLFKETLYLTWVKNTIVIAIATTLLTLFVVSFTGYAYSRYRFKGKRISLMAIMLLQTIPTFAGITAYFTIHSILSSIVPQFTRQMMLVLIYAGGGIASNTFILKGYIDSISRELDDAAKIDGCSNMDVYRLIMMPIAKPMLTIIADRKSVV